MPPHGPLPVLALLATTFANADVCDKEFPVPKPEIVPVGWVTDYDYETNPLEYLRRQYEKAKAEGSYLYVFFYVEGGRKGRRIRRQIVHWPTLQQVFEGHRIVMMEVTRINCIVEAATNRSGPIDFAPLLVKVNSDGSLGSGIDPDSWYEAPLSVTIRNLQQFFDRNDEI